MERLFSKPKLFKLVAAIALVLGLSFAMGALNTSEALAASSDQTITVSVQGVANSTETITYGDLYDAGLIDETVHGYLYQKPTSDTDGNWYVVGAKNSVELTDLFEAAGVSSYWKSGATIMYLTTDYPDGYDKYYTTFEETDRENFFYQAVGATGTAPLTPKVSTPTVLAFDYFQVQIAEGSTSAATLSGTTTFTTGTRFCCGLDDDTVNGLGTTSMGKRMPTDITGIVIIPASSSSNS